MSVFGFVYYEYWGLPPEVTHVRQACKAAAGVEGIFDLWQVEDVWRELDFSCDSLHYALSELEDEELEVAIWARYSINKLLQIPTFLRTPPFGWDIANERISDRWLDETLIHPRDFPPIWLPDGRRRDEINRLYNDEVHP